MHEAKELISAFEKFSVKEVKAAIEELKKIRTETNRKHLQKLVYTNIVNRFDVLLDNLILASAVKGESQLRDLVLTKVKDQTVSSKDFYEILLAEDSILAAEDKVKDLARSSILRERHSAKLRLLLENSFGVDRADLNRPRVSANDGRILATVTPRSRTTPPSIIGYCDYLYAKRNGLVHGSADRSALTEQDAQYLKKLYGIEMKYFGIKIASIESAATFYTYLCNFMKTGKWPISRGW